MSKSDEMTRDKAFEILNRNSAEMDAQRQEYAKYMGNSLSYYGKEILQKMQENGETWEDVEDTKVLPGRQEPNPFYIWTSNYVYFVKLLGGIGAQTVVESIPRNPIDNIHPKWL